MTRTRRAPSATAQDEGFCIPKWWGICHAWAPASILEAEPVHPVTKNGVEFKVNDIKALMTLVYNRPSSRFVSLRCNAIDALDEIEYDNYDRPTGSDVACKDTNPATYHVLLANYIGLQGQAFLEDRTFDHQVWNQPMRAYRVTQLKEVSAQEANALVGVEAQDGDDVTTTNFDGTVEEGAWFHGAAIDAEAGQSLKVVMSRVPKMPTSTSLSTPSPPTRLRLPPLRQRFGRDLRARGPGRRQQGLRLRLRLPGSRRVHHQGDCG